MDELNTSILHPSRLYRLIDDRWNPILVKEVRQAVRGKFFRISFFCTLVAVSLVSMVAIMAMGGDVARFEGEAGAPVVEEEARLPYTDPRTDSVEVGLDQ